MGQTTFSGPVASNNGFTIGSFTSLQRDELTNVDAGTIIFNSTTGAIEVYTGSIWQDAFSPGVGVTYSSANGDWTPGASGFTTGVSWGGGYKFEIDFSTTLSPAALAAFEGVGIGDTLVINTSGMNYTINSISGVVGSGGLKWFFVDTENPAGYPGINIIDAVTFL